MQKAFDGEEKKRGKMSVCMECVKGEEAETEALVIKRRMEELNGSSHLTPQSRRQILCMVAGRRVRSLHGKGDHRDVKTQGILEDAHILFLLMHWAATAT